MNGISVSYDNSNECASLMTLDQQLAELSIGSKETPMCTRKMSNGDESVKPTVKKKKKKVKNDNSTTTTTIKKKKKKKRPDEPLDKRAIVDLDPNESFIKIRFRKYGIEDFRLITLLGTGGFGMVFLSKLINHNAYFAIKFTEKCQIIKNNDYQSVLMERKVMMYGNNNPFICKLFCSFQTINHLCFVMEFCCGGDLKFHLDKEKRFPIPKVRFYLAEMISAIQYLHKLGFIYRDLKLDNIMLGANGHIKLVDFGMCLGKIYREEMQPSDFCGTIEYMAPEVVKSQRYNQSVDYWSLGVVAFEMSVGTYPFTGTDDDEICWFICNQNVTCPAFIVRELQSLISQLLVKSAEERLGMPNSPYGKLTNHTFFADLDWNIVEQGQLCPPFIPNTKSALDTSHFEETFTTATKLTIDLVSCQTDHPDNDRFADFVYTNPNMTD